MAFYHGVKASKQGTSVSTPVTADSGIHFIVGTAPVHAVGGKGADFSIFLRRSSTGNGL